MALPRFLVVVVMDRWVLAELGACDKSFAVRQGSSENLQPAAA